MKTSKLNGIDWFLTEEGPLEAVQELTEQRSARRTYNILEWGDRKIFVKYFLEKGLLGFVRNRIDPRGKREFQTGKRLLAFGICTPEPLGYGLGRSGSFVLQEWVPGQPLWLPVSDPARRPALLKGIARLLQQLREHGVRHNDLHLGNILTDKERLYLIDLHKTRIKGTSLSRADEVANLAHVLGSLFYEMTEKEKEDFFETAGSIEIRPALEERLLEERTRWVERKKARAFSTTSKLTRIGRRVYVKGTEGKDQGPFVECIKNDRKVRVERHSDHIRKIYRDNRRLKKAWNNHVVLEYMELPVVPRAFSVQKGELLARGSIAMEDLQGRGEELDRFLDRHYDTMAEGQVREFMKTFSGFLALILKKGIVHRDMKACNIFALQHAFRLLDVEDLVFRRPTEEDIRRMCVQLNTTVPARIVFSHRVRFFSALMDTLGLGRPERKRIFYEVKRASLGETVVYEGVDGLRKESWTTCRS